LEVDRAVLRAAGELGLRADVLAGAPAELRRWWPPVLEAFGEVLERGGESELVEIAHPETGETVGRLRLFIGDGRRTLARADGALFDAVFLDAFSPGRAPELWEDAFLGSLAASLAPGGVLSTFTVNRRVRAALAAAGLSVSDGPAMGRKRAGTLARRLTQS
jgi:tRNA U34 5-methylaminomethyl-2-thiouridine-forming methyltransferase MnmC